MTKKYIISTWSYHRAKDMARELNIDKNDYIYVPTESNKLMRQSLHGLRIEHPSQLIGHFSSFERDYLESRLNPNTFGFSEALELLKQGKKVKRKHWGGYWYIPKGRVVINDERFILMNETIVACLKDNGGYAPAQPYQEDLLSEDWEEVK